MSGNGPFMKNSKKKKIKITEQDLELQSPFASFVGAFIAHLEKGVSPMQIREKLRKKSEVIKCFGFTDDIGIRCQLGAPEKKCSFEQFVPPREISGNFKASVDCACDRHRPRGKNDEANEVMSSVGVAVTDANVKETKAVQVQWELKRAQTAELSVQASRVEIVAAHFIAENRARSSIGLKGATNNFACQSSLKTEPTQNSHLHSRHSTQSRII